MSLRKDIGMYNKRLASRLRRHIKLALEQISCQHRFKPYGHSYMCTLCHHYCGDNQELSIIAERIGMKFKDTTNEQ